VAPPDPPRSDLITDYSTRKKLEAALRSRASQARTCYPLSHAQLSLLLLNQIHPDSAAYHVALAARLAGLDPAALRRAIQSLVGRHAALRTTFEHGLQPGTGGYQTVHGWLDPDVATVDARGWDERQLDEVVRLDYARPLDIAAGPPIRVRVYLLADGQAFLLLVVHHLVCDFWSLGVMLTELEELYSSEVEQRLARLPGRNVPYSDFVAYQRELLAGEQGRKARSYWLARLSGLPPTAEWPAFRIDPADAGGGGSVPFPFPRDLAQNLLTLAGHENVTPYTVLLTTFQVLLSRYTGQCDVLVGTPAAGRADPAFDGCVGNFVDPAVLRADLSGDPSFREQLRRTRRSVAEALEHRAYPFELLVSELAPRRMADRNPIFQAMFIYQQPRRFPGLAHWYVADPDAAPAAWAGLTLRPFRLAQQEDQLELVLEVVLDDDDRLHGVLRYRKSAFSPEAAQRAVQHYLTLLRAAIANPERGVTQLPLVTGATADRGTVQVCVPEDDSVARRFAGAAVTHRRRVAIRFDGVQLTYGELDELASRWAARLRAEGVKLGDRVALLLEPSLDTVVAIVAVQRARAAYLALDPEHPPARIRAVLADSQVRVSLTQSALADVFAGTAVRALVMEDAELPPAGGESDLAAARDLAYTVYTSGSSGTPKGIDVEHGNVLSLVEAMKEHVAPDENTVWALFHSTGFDLSVWELWGSLLSGACLVVVPGTTARSPDLLYSLLAEERVTHLVHTPSALHGLAAMARQTGGRDLSLQHVFACGEPLPAPLARACLGWCGTLWNLYGPAETTVWVTAHRVRAEDCADTGVPIGLPLANTQAYILDDGGQPVPPEVTGELHISGPCVARGYLNRPELNAERFLDSPFPAGGRLYRTGDLARVNADGLLEVLGRVDNQVKINGFRVELEEVEAHLDELPGVARSAALVVGEDAADRRLVACVIPELGERPRDSDLRAALLSRVPPYMVPSLVAFFETFPLTPNQKVDRARLARQLSSAAAPGETSAPGAGRPLGGYERRVASVWEQVLHRKGIGADDNFFDLGGNSLLLLQVHQLLAPDALGEPLAVSELFRYPTVESLACRLGSAAVILGDRVDAGQQRASKRRSLTADGAVARLRTSGRRPSGPEGDDRA
jgi:amino acid adenylation domain-containing protein